MKNDFQPVVGRKFNFRADPMPQLERRDRLRGPGRRTQQSGSPIAGTRRATRRRTD